MRSDRISAIRIDASRENDVVVKPQGKGLDKPAAPNAVWIPETEAEQRAIREQLERLLANPLFRNSRRYPSLLRYVVEQTLDGRADHLKERNLGVDVFGREPEYDTNVDPVVRATAGEIRKRIAQYYHEPGHESEVRIDLPSGSYVPEFRLPAGDVSGVATAPAARRRGWVALAAAAAVLAAAGLTWQQLRPTALDRFWSPVLQESGSVLLCVGPPDKNAAAAAQAQPARAPGDTDPSLTLHDLLASQNDQVALSDAITLARLAGLMQMRKRPYHIQSDAATTLTDLRRSPVVLIGAFNNDWTMRATSRLRFYFDKDASTQMHWIRDRQHPGPSDWSLNMTWPYTRLNTDYALVSRFYDPATQRMVVTAAGIGQYGTIAAGEFLTDPQYMETMAASAPLGWEQRNMQLVIATTVIKGYSGPPRILATHFWQ